MQHERRHFQNQDSSVQNSITYGGQTTNFFLLYWREDQNLCVVFPSGSNGSMSFTYYSYFFNYIYNYSFSKNSRLHKLRIPWFDRWWVLWLSLYTVFSFKMVYLFFFKMSIVEKLEPSFCHKCAVPSPNSQAQQTTLTPQSSKKRAVCWGGWRFSGGRQRESFPRCRCSLHWSQPHPLPPTRRLPCVSPNPYRLPSPPPTRDAARLICFARLVSLLPWCCKDRYAFSICSWFCVESLLLVFLM